MCIEYELFSSSFVSPFSVGECYTLDGSGWGGFSLYKDMIILLIFSL